MRWPISFGRWACCAALTGALGCASIAPLDNPVLVKPGQGEVDSLEVRPESGVTPEGYAEVYDRVLDALDDYFEVIPASRHSGVVKTYPRIAPGVEQLWKPSTPSAYERVLATFQTLRHFAVVQIDTGKQGFLVSVEVYKQIEVTPIAIQSSGGRDPIFRDVPTGKRMAEIVESPTNKDGQWVPQGVAPYRDFAFEQAILRKIQRPAGLK